MPSLPFGEEIKHQIAPLLVSRALNRRIRKARDTTHVVLPVELIQS